MLKVLLIVTGVLSLVLGIIGIFLPILPTTPFVLLASGCFVKSSPRFHRWLNTHSFFGPIIRNWQTNRAISSQVRRRGSITMVLSFGFSIWVVPVIWVKFVLLFGLLLGLTLFLRLPVNDLVD